MSADTKLLRVLQAPSNGKVIDMANGVFADQPGASHARRDNDLFYIRFAQALIASQADDRAAVAELMAQQRRDAQLVPVLLSYINDCLSARDRTRLVTELTNRGLADHDEKRRAALAAVDWQQ